MSDIVVEASFTIQRITGIRRMILSGVMKSDETVEWLKSALREIERLQRQNTALQQQVSTLTEQLAEANGDAERMYSWRISINGKFRYCIFCEEKQITNFVENHKESCPTLKHRARIAGKEG